MKEISAFLSQAGEAVPTTSVPVFADVRDVAAAHVASMEVTQSQGRILICNGHWDFQKLTDFCSDRFARPQRGERGRWMEGEDEGLALYSIDTSKSKDVLKIEYRTFEQTFGDMIEQLCHLPAAPKPKTDDFVYSGRYLFDRLVEVGVDTVFGLPGDFNFGLCDIVDSHPHLQWAGNAGELGAAYAADGYARVKVITPGVLLTTWGVGELSALNGIMGAFAEMIPLVHIVGMPSRRMAALKLPYHHSLANGDYQVFERVAKEAHVHMAILTGDESDASKIDEALQICLEKRRPVYIGVPSDTTFLPLPKSLLDKPLPVSHPVPETSAPSTWISAISRLNAAKEPIVLFDAGCQRSGLLSQVQALCRVLSSSVTLMVSPLSKGIVDEEDERFYGTFFGAFSTPDVVRKTTAADFILRLGFLELDTNSGIFSARFGKEKLVDVPAQELGSFLDHAIVSLSSSSQSSVIVKPVSSKAVKPRPPLHDGVISQSHFWSILESNLRANDILVADTGTASFGVVDVALPSGASVLHQLHYSSIGWSVGAALGAATAARHRRTILLVGDGSLQTTVQEISTMLRCNVFPVILVLNNDGYTIERVLHGANRGYNDIQPWKYSALLDCFSATQTGHSAMSHIANTPTELEALLSSEAVQHPKAPILIDVKLPRMSAPRILQAARAGSTQTNPTNFAPEYRW